MPENRARSNGTSFAIQNADSDFYSEEDAMKELVKSVGDRELAWIMLAVAGVLLWSTWGLVP